jgi:hypothetical protein
MISLDVDAAVKTGGDASVDGFTEDITDGLLDLSVNSFVKILIWVNYAFSVVVTAGFFSIKVIINFSSSSAMDWVAVALIKVPVIILSCKSSGSWSILREVVLSLVAGLIDLISLVGEATGNVPVLILGNIGAGVARNVGGVGSIKLELRFDNLSRDDNNSSSTDGLGWKSTSWCTWTSILNVDVVVAFLDVLIIAISFPAVVVVMACSGAWASSNAATLSSNSSGWTSGVQDSDTVDSVGSRSRVGSWRAAWWDDSSSVGYSNTEYEEW